jgi:hypothetical protein
MRLLFIILSAVAFASRAEAQVTIDGGVNWLGGYGIGASSAELRTNAPGPSPPPFTLFDVDSRMTSAPGGEIRVGVDFGGWTVEGSAAYARRRLAFSVGNDAEAAAAAFDGESVQTYEFGGGVTFELPYPSAARLRSFAGAGASYLRQLHQDRTLVETGRVFYAGIGARYWLWGRPASPRSAGVRGDLRLNVRRGAVDFQDETRTYPSLSLLLFLGL